VYNRYFNADSISGLFVKNVSSLIRCHVVWYRDILVGLVSTVFRVEVGSSKVMGTVLSDCMAVVIIFIVLTASDHTLSGVKCWFFILNLKFQLIFSICMTPKCYLGSSCSVHYICRTVS